MKKVLFFIFLFIPFIVYADDFSLSLNCPDTANNGDVISCELSAKVSDNINSIRGNFVLEKISYEGFDYSNKLTKINLSSNEFYFKNDDGIKNAFGSENVTIGSLRIKMPSSGSKVEVKINNIYATTTEETIGPKNLYAEINIKTSNVVLTNINVDSLELIPSFSSEILSYKVNAPDKETINISAIASDSSAAITGTGEKKLVYGDNVFEVTIRNNSNSTKTYKIIVNRKDSRDTTNTLRSLQVENYEFEEKFNKELATYNTTVDSNISSIAIKAELTSKKSKFVKKYGPRTVDLEYGDNTFKIQVEAENKTIKTYTININRIDDRDPNNDLGSLKISNGHYTFNKEINRYIINVLNEVETLKVEAKPDSNKASLEVYVSGEKTNKQSPFDVDLKVGTNKFTIKVIAENTKTKDYDFTINRLKEGTNIEDIENIEYLKSLSINGTDMKFNSKTSEYTYQLTDETNLVFGYELIENASGTIELKNDRLGQIKLAEGKTEITIAPVMDGSIVYMDLVSPEGYTKQFTFYVKKAEYYIGDQGDEDHLDIKWSWQMIVGLVSFIIIIGEVIFFIVFTVKNGGVESKTDDFQKSMQGLKNIKLFNKKNQDK